MRVIADSPSQMSWFHTLAKSCVSQGTVGGVERAEAPWEIALFNDALSASASYRLAAVVRKRTVKPKR